LGLPNSKAVEKRSEPRAQRLAQTLETFIPRAEQVMQTVRRILHGEKVPATEKIVSLFEDPHRYIRREKIFPVEYGHKIWLND